MYNWHHEFSPVSVHNHVLWWRKRPRPALPTHFFPDPTEATYLSVKRKHAICHPISHAPNRYPHVHFVLSKLIRVKRDIVYFAVPVRGSHGDECRAIVHHRDAERAVRHLKGVHGRVRRVRQPAQDPFDGVGRGGLKHDVRWALGLCRGGGREEVIAGMGLGSRVGINVSEPHKLRNGSSA